MSLHKPCSTAGGQPCRTRRPLSGVHFTLCGGTIAKLGTAYHHAKYLPGVDDLSLPGCFGMVRREGCSSTLLTCWLPPDLRARRLPCVA
jgi:hypothetical protein